MALWRAAVFLLAGLTSPGGVAAPFERVGPRGALPEAVTALLQDSAGFVWIGSREGLLRYDGFSVKTFRHDPADPGSLPDDAIRTLYEDRGGALWIGTNTGGLARLDRATWTFERFRHDANDPRSLSYDSVYAIAEDRSGDLWVGTQRGLNRLDRRSGRFERFLTAPGGLQDDYVAALAVQDDGTVAIGTVHGGLNLLDRATGTFRALNRDRRDPRSSPGDAVYALARDATGTLWIATDHGLLRRTPRGVLERAGPQTPSGRAPIVSCLSIGSGTVWAGTLGDGLWRIDAETGAVRVLRQGDARRTVAPRGLRQSRARSAADAASDQITAVLVDRSGAVWAGTWGAGLFRVSAAALVLSSSATAIAPPAEVVDEAVTAITAARKGGAFVGTGSGALVRVGSARSPRLVHRFGSDVLSIAESTDGLLWVGTADGLWRLDPASGRSAAFRHDPSDPSSIGPGWVAAVREEGDGLWVGTGEGGLQRVDRRGRVLRRYRHDEVDATTLSDDYVTVILPDRGGTLWIGTRSGGLNALDPATGRAVRYRPEPGRTDGIGHQYVTSIVEDSQGRLWVGTAGGGLSRVERGTDGVVRFTRFSSRDGLVDDDVMAIVEDARGALWIATRRGLSRFDPRTSAFVAYLASDGLPSAEFERGAGARADGLVLLGSLRWVVAVPDDAPFVPAARSETAITSIRTAAGERPGSGAPIRLRQGDWLAVELAVLDFASGGGRAYAYRLGNDRPWVDLGERRDISFAGLSAGTWELQARGRDVQGSWSSAPPLTIRVVPRFWGTTWFRALVLFVALVAGIAVHRARASALERRNRELLAIDEEREGSRAALAAAYERLGLLTRRLEAAKEDERRHIARELHDEFGPNLTAVIINLKLLGGLPDPESARRRIQDSTEIVDRMVQRIRDISLDLSPPLLEEMGLSAALRAYLEAQAARSAIAAEMTEGRPLPPLSPEIAITAFRVAQEALTNVIRHAGAAKVKVSVDSTEGGLQIAVEDDGKGFDVRATMAGPASRALGLLGMQERARLLGGGVRITSEEGIGSRVVLELPFEVRA